MSKTTPFIISKLKISYDKYSVDKALVDQDFELRRGPALIYLPSRLFFLPSFLRFSPKIRRGGGGGASRAHNLDPPLQSLNENLLSLLFQRNCLENKLQPNRVIVSITSPVRIADLLF